MTNRGRPEFTDQELNALRDIALDWIGEGFTTLPYKPEVASAINKLGIRNNGEDQKR